jgi:hypothetical protein
MLCFRTGAQCQPISGATVLRFSVFTIIACKVMENLDFLAKLLDCAKDKEHFQY